MFFLFGEFMDFRLTKNMQILIIFIIAGSVLTVAQSIITTGTVQIMGEFGVSSTVAQWTYSAFLLVVGIMMPLCAYLSRRYSVRKIFLFSVGIFIIGSLVCYFSTSIEILIIGRILEAIGNGILIPFNQILILKMVPEEDWQINMGIFGLVIGFAPVCGLVVGGFIIDLYTWRALFSIFAILAIIIMAIGLYIIDVDLGTEDYPLDLLSVGLSIVGCAGIMLGFTNIAEYGFISLFVFIPIIVGIIALILFVKRQGNLEKPLINLEVLKNKYFSAGIVFICIFYFGLNGYTALVPLFVQGVAYYSATISALIIFPGAILMILANIIGPILVGKIGIKKLLALATVISIIGYGTMMFYTAETTVLWMVITQAIRCLGLGLILMPVTTWSLTMVSDKVEDGTAVNNTLRQIAAAIGSSMVVVIVAILAGGNIAHNQMSVTAFNETALIMVILNIIMLLIVIFIIDDKEKIESKNNC